MSRNLFKFKSFNDDMIRRFHWAKFYSEMFCAQTDVVIGTKTLAMAVRGQGNVVSATEFHDVKRREQGRQVCQGQPMTNNLEQKTFKLNVFGQVNAQGSVRSS